MITLTLSEAGRMVVINCPAGMTIEVIGKPGGTSLALKARGTPTEPGGPYGQRNVIATVPPLVAAERMAQVDEGNPALRDNPDVLARNARGKPARLHMVTSGTSAKGKPAAGKMSSEDNTAMFQRIAGKPAKPD